MNEVLEQLLQICQKLGVPYNDIDKYSENCEKIKYLLSQISQFIA